VTFVSLQTGWVLGATCATCTVSILRTRDGGKTWASIPAPPTTVQTGGGGAMATRVRFADLNNGWVAGPDLWATHDGGAHWVQPVLPAGTPVVVEGLEAAAGLAHAVFNPPREPASTKIILTSPVGSDGWTASPTTLDSGPGPVAAAAIVLQGSSGWIVMNNRAAISGARLVHGAWVSWHPPCGPVGGDALLAAAIPSSLVAACSIGYASPAAPVGLYESTDGSRFARLSAAPPGKFFWGVASPVSGTVVVASRDDAGDPELFATFDGGGSWGMAFQGQGAYSLNDLGFTSPAQGVVIETGEPGRLLMTHDGGHTWAPVPFTQALR
jgi:hypothetical protein